MRLLAMTDVFWTAAWPAAALVVGSLGSEVRNLLQRRADEKRKLRADALDELSKVIETLRKEMDDRDCRHAKDMTEIRGQHSDCQDQYSALKSDYDSLKTDHEKLKSDFSELQATVKGLNNRGSS